ncbi:MULTISPECIES: sensor histidine kinase [Metabacillus]|uniref:sensor histidine kinase n=1 Tax=Metabacillus TaxID=2675233 RepID=UPI00158ED9EA|nr:MULTISPECIES: HAMP domain-containing sensor histidine kinase [Metabacillus]MCM3443361.1 ATP-binding protein [Metabacillus halosaccharovorans]
MKWNSIVVKLGASILLLVLAILLPLGFIMNQIFSGFYFSKVQEQIDHLSDRYADSINSLDEQHLKMFELLATMIDQEIVIVDDMGIVVANSGVPSLPKGEKINSDKFDSLANNAASQNEYYDDINNKRYLSIGKPIYSDKVFIGGIFVLASIENMYKSVDMIEKSVILAGIGAIFLALGFTFILSRKLSNPLLEMEKATRKIAKGDLNTRVSKRTKDEIGSLATGINDLAVELHRYRSNRREFLANISHELRTPITYLEGYANALENNLYQSEEEKKQYLQIIQQEAVRMSKLVNDLFELSKMEEGKVELLFEDVDLVEVVENALLKTKMKAKRKGLQLDFTRLAGIPSIYADGLRMEQIVINLIENAIRYTEDGLIKVTLSSDSNTVRLTVEDTGIGIPEEDVPFLFERFYRVEKSRSRESGGTGLGLAIVKHLVELQGGTISVKSKVGKGTCFELTFPIDKGDAQ